MHDVVVVGGGGAGLAAAAEAAGLGRRVILLEKGQRLGGSTAWSVGSISASNTPQQRAAGIVDHPDAHFEDLETLAGSMANRDNRLLRRLLVDNITDTMAWLEKAGLVFVGPNPEPPHRLPRMHNVLPNSRAFPEISGCFAGSAASKSSCKRWPMKSSWRAGAPSEFAREAMPAETRKSSWHEAV